VGASRGLGPLAGLTVRKISYGEGVERVSPLYSPMVEEIEVKRCDRPARIRERRTERG